MALRPIADIFEACLTFAPSSFSRRRACAASSAAAAATADDSATAITTTTTGSPPSHLPDRVAADVCRSPALALVTVPIPRVGHGPAAAVVAALVFCVVEELLREREHLVPRMVLKHVRGAPHLVNAVLKHEELQIVVLPQLAVRIVHRIAHLRMIKAAAERLVQRSPSCTTARAVIR